MNSNSLQQNFILFLEKAKETKEAPRNFNGRLCCEKCRFSTKDTALFERHVAQHEEVTFSCTICNHISYSRVESQRHLVKHKGSYPYKCSWCPYGAVRRDYMVKHIQRIHGKSADGIFMTDCNKKMEGTKGLCLPTPTLGGPSHDVQLVSHSAGNVASLLCSDSQTRANAPYHVTSTTCSLPVKSQPYIVPNTTQKVCKMTQGTVNPTNFTVKEVGPTVGKAIEYINKMTEKSSSEKTAVTGVLPRVHVGISGDRAVQLKPPLQSQVVGTTVKTTVQSKIIPKIQVKYPVNNNNNHLKPLLSNHPETPVAQKSVIYGAVQNIPVAHVVKRSIPSTANPSSIGERFRQGTPFIKHVVQTPGKNSPLKSRPNILVRTPPKNLESSTKSGVQVGLFAPLNQPIQHNRPLMISGAEERAPPQPNVQVELLAPLNQPLQHNKPLTVSCPEEITIPAGCLVELVEVKNVNGTRELELRLVPQQLQQGPQQETLKSTSAATTNNRLSFKCKVATDDCQAINMNYEINAHKKADANPEHLVQGSRVKKLTVDKVNVKNEAEVNEKVLCSRKNGIQAPGSSSKWFHAVSKSVVSKPSESHKFTQQLCAGHKNVATEPVRPLSNMHCTVRNISPSTSNKNITADSLKYELRAAQPSSNKQEDADLSRRGLPVISSVFSLCPIPQNTLSPSKTREGEAQIPAVSGSNDSIKITANTGICRPTLKTEDETRLLTDNVQKYGQLSQKMNEILEQTKVPENKVKKKLDTMGEKTFANHEEDKIIPEICRSSTDVLQTDPSNNTNRSSIGKSEHSPQPEKMEEKKLESEKCLLAQSSGPPISSMNPTVALIRMPSLEVLSLSEPTNKAQEKRDGEESITARPVVCCTSNQQNIQERTIKLVLKRKWSETNTDHDQRTGILCIDIPPTKKKAKKEKKKAKRNKTSKDQQLLEKSTMGKMCLMPLKDDQLVRCPGLNQPVVVLNHPNPLVKMVNVEGQTLNNMHFRHSAPDLCNQDGTTSSNPVRPCPAVKLTLKKVQGQKYQVTELLLKGVPEITVL